MNIIADSIGQKNLFALQDILKVSLEVTSWCSKSYRERFVDEIFSSIGSKPDYTKVIPKLKKCLITDAENGLLAAAGEVEIEGLNHILYIVEKQINSEQVSEEDYKKAEQLCQGTEILRASHALIDPLFGSFLPRIVANVYQAKRNESVVPVNSLRYEPSGNYSTMVYFYEWLGETLITILKETK